VSTGPLLDVRRLCKRFGALAVTDEVDLQVHAGRIHALIGPNGAGKTTLVAQLAGQLPSDSGEVRLDGHDITRLVAHERARRGLLRSFQITRLFRSLSVLDNLVFAARAAGNGNFSAWRERRHDGEAHARAAQVMHRMGLAGKAAAAIDELSHGEQRALEVGMALAARPRLLLLDEPMAGMGAEESEQMAALIAGLRQDCAVLLIEHDVQAVFRLADTVSVLVNGRLIASGEPAAVRSDPGVVAAYLGEQEGV
jgi:branched-chain amino acid transport system ATP-binding protein